MKTRGATGASGIECLVLKTTSTRSRRSASGTATWSQVSLSGALTTMFCARGCPKRSRPSSEANTSTYSLLGSTRSSASVIRRA